MGDEGGDGTGGFEELPTEIEGVIGVWVEAVTVVILTVVIGVEMAILRVGGKVSAVRTISEEMMFGETVTWLVDTEIFIVARGFGWEEGFPEWNILGGSLFVENPIVVITAIGGIIKIAGIIFGSFLEGKEAMRNIGWRRENSISDILRAIKMISDTVTVGS